MSNNFIENRDRVSARYVQCGLRGEVIFGTGKKQIPFIDPYGNKSYRTECENGM